MLIKYENLVVDEPTLLGELRIEASFSCGAKLGSAVVVAAL